LSTAIFTKRRTLKSVEALILSRSAMPSIGVKDGLMEDPRLCNDSMWRRYLTGL
jgi:hypothetical protein